MEKTRVRIYTDYKSPYAFVANIRLFELEQKHGVELEWLPYTLRVAEFMGTVEERTPHFWRKVRYAYMDARRFANAQGLTMKGPRRIYHAFYASAGMLFAQRHGFFRPYHDTVFRRFWSHDLDIDDVAAISGVIASVGGSAKDFEAFVEGPARAWLHNGRASKSSVPPSGSVPCRVSAVRTASVFNASFAAPDSFSMIAGGVPAGASSPIQIPAS